MPESKPRVAFLLPRLGGGGAERIILNLSEAFASRDYQVDLITQVSGGEMEHQVPNRIRTVTLGHQSTLQALIPLLRYALSQKPVAILSALDSVNLANVMAGRLLRRTRTVISIHTFVSAAYAELDETKRKRLALMRKWYPKADRVVCVSKDGMSDAGQFLGIPSDKMRTIYNPVVSKRFFDLADQPITQDQRPYAIFVGRLTETKQVVEFIETMPTEPQNVVILGEGPTKAKIQEAIVNRGFRSKITLVGFKDNPYPWIKAAQVLILPSRLEGLPTVLVEALALGTPVISFDCKSGPREILADGEYGDLIAQNDWAAFHQALNRRLSEPKPEVSPAAWEPFLEDRAFEAYREVLLQ